MELCFGQRIDPTLGILEPWYTHEALDKIKSWDLSDKVVFEYGGGASTIWWANKAKIVLSVDHNYEWAEKVRNELPFLGDDIKFVETREGDQSEKRDEYVNACDGMNPDIVIVDGIHRYECIVRAVEVLKPAILIVDNWWQDYVFICPSAVELLKDFRQEIYIQPDHKEHEGNPWKTAIFYLNEKL